MTSPAPRDPAEWAALLRTNWEKRARSPSRDFYVASCPGWNDAQRWEQQAESDADFFLTGLDDAFLADAEVLEVGCGVGRLARPLAQRVRSYTGVDIAPGMVEEAGRRCADLTNARFFVSSGDGIAAEARDRRYRLIVFFAVLIHCPKALIAALVGDAFAQLDDGGQLRFNVRADPDDPTGIEAPAATVERAHDEMAEVQEAVVTDAEMALIDDHYYMGDAFRYDELPGFFESACGTAVDVVLRRFDAANIYGWLRGRDRRDA